MIRSVGYVSFCYQSCGGVWKIWERTFGVIKPLVMSVFVFPKVLFVFAGIVFFVFHKVLLVFLPQGAKKPRIPCFFCFLCPRAPKTQEILVFFWFFSPRGPKKTKDSFEERFKNFTTFDKNNSNENSVEPGRK